MKGSVENKCEDTKMPALNLSVVSHGEPFGGALHHSHLPLHYSLSYLPHNRSSAEDPEC